MSENMTGNTSKNNDALKRVVTYATFNTRLMAATVDIMLITLIALPVSQILQSLFIQPINIRLFAAVLASGQAREQVFSSLLVLMRQEHVIEKLIINNILQIALIAAYILPFWIKRGTTPGKMLMGIEILDAVTLQPMRRRQMVVRFAGYLVSGLGLTLGFVWMVFNKKRQCWHDSIAGTVVVKKEKKAKPAQVETPHTPA